MVEDLLKYDNIARTFDNEQWQIDSTASVLHSFDLLPNNFNWFHHNVCESTEKTTS